MYTIKISIPFSFSFFVWEIMYAQKKSIIFTSQTVDVFNVVTLIRPHVISQLLMFDDFFMFKDKCNR